MMVSPSVELWRRPEISQGANSEILSGVSSESSQETLIHFVCTRGSDKQ